MNIDIGRREIWICAGAILLAACAHATRAKAPGPGAPVEPWRDLLPAPVSAERGAGAFPVAPGWSSSHPRAMPALESRDNSPRCCGERPACCREFCRRLKERPRVASCCRSTPTSRDRRRGLRSHRRSAGNHDQGGGAGWLVLRRADVPPAAAVLVEYEALNFGKPKPASVSAVHIVDRPALRVARRDARRRAPFLRGRRRQAVHRSAGTLQVQPAASASRRRPGLAHRDQVVAEAGDARRQQGSRRRRRRVLHAAAVRRSRRLRRRSIHHRRPRDRHARAHQCGAVVATRS